MPIDPDPLAVPRPSDAATPLAGSSTAGAGGPDGLHALPSWLRRAVQAWGVRRSDSSWVGGVLAGVAERYRVDPLLARGVFVALCVVSAGFGLLAYAVAWALLPDGDGTVHYGRLRRGEWQDATVAIAVIGGIGVLNVVLGAGFTLLAPVVGGPGSLLGLAAVAVLVWWLVTRWDGSTQSRVGPAPASEPEASGRAAARPAWYLRRDDARAAASRQDAHGFRADWLDPETGTWRSPVHSRELRAAARLAEEEQAAPAGPSGRGSAVVAAPRRLSPAVQAVTYAVAALAAAAAVGASLLLGVGSLTLLAVPAIVAALAVIAPVMLAALLTGRRPGSLAPASGILVGAAALQVAVAVAVL